MRRFASLTPTVASVDVGNTSCEVIQDSDPGLADRCSLSGFERNGGSFLLVAGLIVSGLVFERLIAGCRAASVYRDPAALAFPILHTARDAAWAVAIVVWCVRRIVSMPTRPAFSMHPRPSDLRMRTEE